MDSIKIIDSKVVSVYLGITTDAVRSLIYSGKLAAKKVKGKYQFKIADVKKYAKDNKIKVSTVKSTSKNTTVKKDTTKKKAIAALRKQIDEAKANLNELQIKLANLIESK